MYVYYVNIKVGDFSYIVLSRYGGSEWENWEDRFLNWGPTNAIPPESGEAENTRTQTDNEYLTHCKLGVRASYWYE